MRVWWNCSRHSLSPCVKNGLCFAQLLNPWQMVGHTEARGSWGSSFNSLPSVQSCVYTNQGLKIGTCSLCFLCLETTLSNFRPWSLWGTYNISKMLGDNYIISSKENNTLQEKSHLEMSLCGKVILDRQWEYFTKQRSHLLRASEAGFWLSAKWSH